MLRTAGCAAWMSQDYWLANRRMHIMCVLTAGNDMVQGTESWTCQRGISDDSCFRLLLLLVLVPA